MTLRFSVLVGPCNVTEIAARLNKFGRICAAAGTERVYGTIEAADKFDAALLVNDAAGYRICRANDFFHA